MWPSIGFEESKWVRDPEELAVIPKSRRRKIAPIYMSAVPAEIAALPVELSGSLSRRAAEASMELVRFDAEQRIRGYDLPAILLRSESSSSSQIERLTSSAKNIALAELTDKAPSNARLIAGNVAAMRTAISHDGPVDVETICQVHNILIKGTNEPEGLREEQVWIGGTPYSPHGAEFVPPRADRLDRCLADLVAFGSRDDVQPIAKAAIFHAQLETIHPFTDGNGRTGRAILHSMLAYDEVLRYATLPVSAGLLHDVDSYMAALDSYHEGDVDSIVECLVAALELSVVIGAKLTAKVDALLEEWAELTTERKGSAAHRLPALLVKQPVVDTVCVAERLGITDRAARSLVESACERGILARMGNARRGAFYQAPDLIDLIEEASSIPGIKRLART